MTPAMILPASGSAEDTELLAELTARLASWHPSSDLDVVVMPASPDLAVRRDLWEPALHGALERQRDGHAAVLVLHLRPHDWSGTAVAELPALSGGRAVTDWPDRTQAWDDVERCLRALAARGFVASARGAMTAAAPSGTTDRAHRNRLRQGVQATELSSPGAPPPFHAPSPPDPLFASRDETLAAVAAGLAKPSGRAEPHTVVLVGPPGAGKSALAAAYAHRHRDTYPGGVFWCNAAEPGWSASIAEQLHAPQARYARRASVDGHELGMLLAERSGWLLVLDGASDETEWGLRHHLVGSHGSPAGAVLATSQWRVHASGGIDIPVGPLDEVEGASLLGRVARRAGSGDPLEAAAARTIARSLGGFPGAVVLAGLHLARRPELSFMACAELLDREIDAIEQEAAAMPHFAGGTAGQRAAFALSWGALPVDAQIVFRLLLASSHAAARGRRMPSRHAPLSRRCLAALAGLAQEGLSDALARLDAAGFLDGAAGESFPRASRCAAWLAGAVRETASFARECAIGELERMLDPLTIEQRARELSFEELLLDAEAMRQLLGRSAPHRIAAWLQVLRGQSQALPRWDRKGEPDRLLVQLRDGAFEAGDDKAVERIEETLRARGRPWLRRRNESRLGSGRVLGMHEGAVTALVLSEDGRLALSGSEDGAVMCWALDRGELLAELRGHTGAVREIALATPPSLAVTASDDGTLKVWDLPSGTERFTLRWHLAGVYSITVAPDGRTAESRAHDGCACTWDLSTGLPLRARAASGSMTEPAPGPAPEVAANADHDLVVRDRASGEVQRVLMGHTGEVLCTALHSSGRLVSGGTDWTVRLWNVPRGALFVPGDQVLVTAMTPGGRLAISASLDGTLAVREVSTGRLTRAWQSGQKGILALAAPSEERLISASETGIQTWDLGSGERVATMTAPAGLSALGVAPGGRRAATLSASAVRDRQPRSRLSLWDMDAAALLREVELPGLLPCVAFASEDQVVIAEAQSGAVHVVSFASGEVTRSFEGQARLTGALAAAPEAGWLFFSTDGKLVAADSSTGEMIQSLPFVPSMRSRWGSRLLSVTPDGRTLALIAASGGPAAHPERAMRAGRLSGDGPRSGLELVVVDVPAGRVVGRLALGLTADCCTLSPDGRTVLLGGAAEVRRQVIKKHRPAGVGGWFDEVRQRQARVYFVDVVS